MPVTKTEPVLPFRLITFLGEGDRVKIDRFETRGEMEMAANKATGRAVAAEVVWLVDRGDEGSLTARDVAEAKRRPARRATRRP